MPAVLVLFGGKSAEHEVSCESAATVADSLREAGHSVTLVGIDLAGGWHLVDGASRPLTAVGDPVSLSVPDGFLDHGGTRLPFDVVFPVLHGPFGEDGTVQGLLEVVGVPYVGAGVLASAAAMDKDVANRLLAHAGLPRARSMAVSVDSYGPGVDARLLEALGLPVFVKPASLGSSVGITKVNEAFELPDAMAVAFKYGDKVVVEEGVDAREIEVAVLDGPNTSIPGEIVSVDWYDYDAKYADDATQLLVPAPLTDEESDAVRDLAGRAFEILGVTGLARVDFFYEESGRGFLINELNTMPGCTSRSMFPVLWEATGVPNVELFDRLVRSALP
ncbi:MAG: D-alanine--D-alanine ligase [Acidimicrobiia bacterium]|nr:D-alanine--D-alanine ligase [Acidimicrobiia bacterium]MBT8194160.1 D-alanine--D-alanine ligase [Acidimicrobiia bacterium]MBT8247992.1 D-alanine--D-alanine ligase [Acidimicrobiia bacterium]NNF88331.1 D-alanine--D-alanine ligase [Acidimicrobiia bacterium]NNJ46278.1 D-alanine--D-alanine ligase [Acidimicrobiia bacterium]